MKQQQLITIERKFRPEIEGLRIVAALLVAIYHIWFNKVSGGVDVFFVISGFLITSSIISTINRTGGFQFWPYISKLIKRLFPSMLFILGFVLILSFFLLPDSLLDKTIGEVMASLFYYQNWELAFSSTDYLDAAQTKTPVQHFWALSIQGQFYIIWFILFTFMLFFIKKIRNLNPRMLINAVLGMVFLLSLSYSVYLTQVNQPWAYFSTFTRVWEFALGGLICVNLSYIKINRALAVLLGWSGLIGLIATGFLFDVSKMFPGYIALWPMTCAFFIILSGTQDTKYSVSRFLGMPVMVKLGGISFGIYLWHWVLLEFYRYNIGQTPSIIVGILIILASIAVSYLMTHYVEKPIRQARYNRFAFKRLGVSAAFNFLLIAVLVISINIQEQRAEQAIANEDYPGAMAAEHNVDVPDVEPTPPKSQVFDDLPPAHSDGSNQTLADSDLKIGEYGETADYDGTIALIGSSHSEQWQGAILEAADDHPNYRILNITRSGTRFSTTYDSSNEYEKDVWIKHVLDYLKDADVDLVISQGTASHSPTKAVHQQMIDQMQYVKDEYGIDVLVIRDNPRYSFNVLESLETNGLKKTKKKMNNETDNQNDESFWNNFEKNNQSLYKLDLTDYFKVNGEFAPVIGNVIVYRDANHITNTYSETLAPVFEKKIFDEVLE